MSWKDVRKEMVEEKGLAPEIADRIGDYVKKSGSRELIKELFADAQFVSNEKAKSGLEQLDLLFNFLSVYEVLDNVWCFTVSGVLLIP